VLLFEMGSELHVVAVVTVELVAPLRLVLGGCLLGAARAAGSSTTPALLAFAGGAFGIAFLFSNDPRARFRRGSGEPDELPADATVAPAWLHALHAALPSTVGVSVLAALALPFQPTLSALLAGILAGLGFAALLAAYGTDPRLYLDPQRRIVFRK
jgi:hypothetical protein